MKALMSACLFLTLLSPVSSKTGPAACLGGRSHQARFSLAEACKKNVEDRICYSKVIEFPMEGIHKDYTNFGAMGCMRLQDCHPDNYTATLPDGGYIHMEVKCCKQKTCNRPLKVPDQKKRPLNKKKCPSCLTIHTDNPCSSKTTVSCHGKENKCISFTGTVETPGYAYPRLSFKGCATNNLCNLLTGASEKGKDLLEPKVTVEAKCSPAK